MKRGDHVWLLARVSRYDDHTYPDANLTITERGGTKRTVEVNAQDIALIGESLEIAIRGVVAAQWATAIELFRDYDDRQSMDYDERYQEGFEYMSTTAQTWCGMVVKIAGLPPAVDIVDGAA